MHVTTKNVHLPAMQLVPAHGFSGSTTQSLSRTQVAGACAAVEPARAPNATLLAATAPRARRKTLRLPPAPSPRAI
jgi:hypothetical protein